MSRSGGSMFDVAIVGLGPVGIALASLLAMEGHSVIGLDAAKDVFELPRAIGLDHEAMRLFQNLGIADRMQSMIEPYRPSEYRAADGGVLRQLKAAPEPFPLSWPPNLTFVQPELERLLRANAARWPNLQLRLGAEVIGIAEADGGVEISLRNEAESVSCKYLVGCDGGGSFVRKAISSQLEDLDFDEPWLVVDMLLHAPMDLPELNIQFCDPARPATYVRGPGLLRRWEFMILPGEEPSELTRPESIWRLLSPWLKPDQARIWRAATYRFHALVVEKWRRGRVFLAGDAAHQTPPFLAQGLNQGVRDSSNLAWKLSAVLRGAPDRLLDSYEAERRPNVRQVIAITKDLGREICERDPVAAEARDLRLKADFAAGKGVRVRQDLLPRLQNRLSEEDMRDAGRPGVGELAPQPWILGDDGVRTRLDDLLGGGIHVLVGADFELCGEVLAAAKRLGAKVARIVSARAVQATSAEGAPVLAEESDLFGTWMAQRNGKALVARPDHAVFGMATTGEELVRVLQTLGLRLGV